MYNSLYFITHKTILIILKYALYIIILTFYKISYNT